MSHQAASRRALVVGAINRPDILAMFDAARGDVALEFLEYRFAYGTRVDPGVYARYGAVRFWDEHRHVDALLDATAPDVIAFMYITSLNQMALVARAKERGIRTFHLEHGFRRRYDDPLHAWGLAQWRRRRFTWRKLRTEAPVAARNHAFFARSLASLNRGAARALASFAARSYVAGDTPERYEEIAALRRPDVYLAFSPETMAFHAAQDRVPPDHPVRYIGIPYFDDLARIRPGAIDPRNVLLVDHQFHMGRILGWDMAFRRRWVGDLSNVIRALGLRLHVKEHPGDVSRSWDDAFRSGEVVRVARDGLADVLERTSIVLGTFSTMQLPLAALPHTSVVCLEIHPQPGHFPSRSLVDSGAADVARSFDDLRALLSDADGMRRRQAAHKGDYERQFLYRFDGLAGERLREALRDG